MHYFLNLHRLNWLKIDVFHQKNNDELFAFPIETFWNKRKTWNGFTYGELVNSVVNTANKLGLSAVRML